MNLTQVVTAIGCFALGSMLALFMYLREHRGGDSVPPTCGPHCTPDRHCHCPDCHKR